MHKNLHLNSFPKTSISSQGESSKQKVLLLLLHPFNGLFSRTTWVSQHQKGKPFWILLEQELMGWQGHQLEHMQIICTSLQTDNHVSTSPNIRYNNNNNNRFTALCPSTMIHSILPVQTACLAIFLHNLSPRPFWFTSWSGALHLIFHTFLHPVNVFFLQHMAMQSQPVLLWYQYYIIYS